MHKFLSIVGAPGVGKTSIIKHVLGKDFHGVDIRIKQLAIEIYEYNDKFIAERRRVGVIHGTGCFEANSTVVFVYDVTNVATYEYIMDIIDHMKKYDSNFANGLVKYIICGNKCDLLTDNSDHLQVSCKTGHNIDSIKTHLGLSN